MASCDEVSDDGVHTHNKRNKGKRKEQNVESGPKSAKKTKSWVWDHFTRQKDNYDKANCNFCSKEMLVPTKSGTSNMKKHLILTCKGYNVWVTANKFNDQAGLTPDGPGGNLTVCKVSESVVREAVNEMIVLAELPLAFVESLAWKYFCSRAQLYKPHSRRTATRDIVEMYVKKKAEMKKIFEGNKQRLSLTTDIWVAPHTGSSYMVITAHFVDQWWQLRKLIIGFKNVYDHKGATICKVLIDCLEEWDIKKVFCITLDNATANSSAIRRFKEEFVQNGEEDALLLQGDFLHLRCATHILNLIVKEALLEIEGSVNAIRNAIHYIRSSTPRLKSFENRVESGRVQRGSLPLDVKTRWNSTYLMLEQALKFRLAFDKMESEDKPYNDYFTETVEGKKRIGPPTKADWEAVDRLVQFLIIFYKATLALSASNTVCSSKLYHAIVTVTRNITALSKAPGPDETLRSKALAMLGKLEKYWNPFGVKVEMNRLVIVAGVFDPSKKMKFIDKCFDKLYGANSIEGSHLHDEIMDILKKLFDVYSCAVNKNVSGPSGASSQSHGASSQSQEQSVDEVSQKTFIGNGLQYESMNDIYNELVQEAGFQEKTNELELYLKEGVEIPNLMRGSEFDVLSWWRVNSPKFPVLSLIAKDILAMQVSSVASESAFSTSGRILDPSRSCLTHYMIEVLMCTEQWLKCQTKVNDKGVTRKEQLLAEVELEDDLMREFEPAFQSQAPGP